MTEPWRAGDGTETKAVVLLPDGTEHKVNDSDPFAETIRKIAREAGLSKFNVKVDGSQIDASDAPNDFKGVDEVELVKYDEGA